MINLIAAHYNFKDISADDLNIILQGLAEAGPWKVVNPVLQNLIAQANDPTMQSGYQPPASEEAAPNAIAKPEESS
jgi:hypothetical protein